MEGPPGGAPGRAPDDPAGSTSDDPAFAHELQLLLEAIYHTSGYDFRSYAIASLDRRVRLALHRLDCKTLAELQQRIRQEPVALQQLLDLMTVHVSEMFRDPAYFLALRQDVVPMLRGWPALKIWVAGCSGGEEAYSLAILLHEEGLLSRSLIYATDISIRALEQADAGVYEIDRIAQFSVNHRASGGRTSLSDYYTAAYGRAVLGKALKRHIVFSDHSLATDDVFAEVHLISCRNVLIYFDRQLQDRAIGLFDRSLVPRGYLGIGSAESLRFSAHADRFESISASERIFRKRDLPGTP